MQFVRQVWTILKKDLKSEFRKKEMVLSMCFFSFLVLIIFSFTFDAGSRDLTHIIPGILWVAFTFSGLMGLNRSFGIEHIRGTLPGLVLCPVTPWGIFFSKMIGTFIFTTFMEIFTLFILTILYNQNLWKVLPSLGLIIFLGTLGFTTIGTLLSAMTAASKAGEVILSILVFPISIPMMIASVKATGTILAGGSIIDVLPWLKILVAFDLVFLLIPYLTFGFIIEE